MIKVGESWGSHLEWEMGGMEWGQGAGRYEGMMHGKWCVCVCVFAWADIQSHFQPQIVCLLRIQLLGSSPGMAGEWNCGPGPDPSPCLSAKAGFSLCHGDTASDVSMPKSRLSQSWEGLRKENGELLQSRINYPTTVQTPTCDAVIWRLLFCPGTTLPQPCMSKS